MATKATRTSLCWIKASGGESVDNAVVAGNAGDGAELHVARVQLDPELAPGKLHIGHSCAYIPFHEEEEQHDEYEVLANPGCVELEWVSASEGEVPIGAVEGGTCGQGEPIYLARCQHEDDLVPGKVVPRTGAMYIPWGCKEYTKTEYEVMCVKSVKPLPVEDDC